MTPRHRALDSMIFVPHVGGDLEMSAAIAREFMDFSSAAKTAPQLLKAVAHYGKDDDEILFYQH